MNLRTDQPWWLLRNGILADYPPLERSLSCDVAVVGGGVTGALLADRLTRMGRHVVLLDRRSIGEGSTAASTALLQYEVDTPLRTLSRRIGEQAAVRVYRLGLDALDSIAALARPFPGRCGFARRQSVQLASRPQHVAGLAREAALRRNHGFRCRMLAPHELTRRYGFPHAGALLTAEAAEIDPYRLTHALLQRAIRRGAIVRDRTEVLRYAPRPRGVLLETARGHTVRAGHVVFATGYETMDFMRRGLTTIRTTYALVTDPVGEIGRWRDRALIWETARPYLYLRRTRDGRVIIGGGDDPLIPPALRERRLPRKTAWLARKLAQLFPGLRFDVAFSWAGSFAETHDTLPMIGGTPEYPRALFALGYGGNGITFSMIAAEMIERELAGQPHPDAALFAFGRAAKAPAMSR